MCTGINNYRIKIRYEVVKDTRNTYIIELKDLSNLDFKSGFTKA